METQMNEMTEALTLLHEPEEIIEIRSISPRPVISGYFRADSPNVARELARYPDRTFYQTMNPIYKECYARAQHEKLTPNPAETTSDRDIMGYRWILVDADPVRPAGVSASREEKEAAHLVAVRVMRRLVAMGFQEPIAADSGNGYHLLFRIHTGPEDRQLIADFLSVLDLWFSTEQVKIDTAVFNAARITKLYGTVARKGADTEERPHRRSRILRVPEGGAKETAIDLVRQVAGELPKEPEGRREAPRGAGAGGSSRDPLEYLASHGVEILRKTPVTGGTKYLLKACPFNPEHRNGDAAVFIFDDGRRGFHCFHNSCAGNRWHEFRRRIDPEAYAFSPYAVHQATAAAPPEKQPEREPRMLDIAEIPDVDRSRIEVVRSRLGKLDSLIGGFNKGELSVWSGGNASGKSTLVGQLGLAAISEGYKAALFSGEMTAGRVREWILLQAAGPDNVRKDPLNGNHYCLKPGVAERLDLALKGNLAVYDNNFGTEWETVIRTVEDWVKKQGASVVTVDNLMALDLPAAGADKYDLQSRIVKRFAAMAKELNVHVHFICHPRKSEAFLRKTDISGTADITNAADNVFMVHRVNADFRSLYHSVYPQITVPEEAGNVIEIMKNRDLGICDELIPLYYDRRCKTLSDIRGVAPRHAWNDPPEQQEMTLVSDPELPEEWTREEEKACRTP